MRVTVAAVGRWKNDPARAVYETYACRGHWPVTLKEVTARKPGTPESLRTEEAALLAAAVPEGAVRVALDAGGRMLDSPGFAAWLDARRETGARDVAFLIGGAEGLAGSLLEGADLRLSLGPMTWPHMLVRALLAEQLYRAQSILAGHPYHR